MNIKKTTIKIGGSRGIVIPSTVWKHLKIRGNSPKELNIEDNYYEGKPCIILTFEEDNFDRC